MSADSALPGEQDPPADGSAAPGLPPSGPLADGARADPRPAGGMLVDPQILTAVIAQAAAIVAIVTAIVYAAGALSLVFKLWYVGVPSLPVLVQLPRTWSISQALTEVLPIAVAAGMLAVWVWNRVRTSGPGRLIAGPGPDAPGSRVWARRWVVSALIALVFAGVAIVIARYVWIGPIPAGTEDQSRGTIYPRPWWNILILCLVLDTIAIRFALHFGSGTPRLPRLLSRVPRDAFRAAIVALAFVPIVASTSEAFAFPLVKLCGQAFYTPGKAGRHYAFGNLIGISGQYVYVAELLTKKVHKHPVFAAGYIAVIPQSEAQLTAIGRNASCGQLAAPAPTPAG
jgi:hypothetical protein